MSEKPMTKDEIVKETQSILNKQPFYKTRKIKPVITLDEFIKFRDKMARPS